MYCITELNSKIFDILRWWQRVYTKTAQNQNGPQIFDMSKTAHIDVQNGPTQAQNGPEL